VITNASSLLPLPFLGWLPAADPQIEIEPVGTAGSLPQTEMFEHHLPGSQAEQPFLPDLIPEFMRTPVASTVGEESVE
jgi:hypothetical protein